tara:strand:+ start:274 stop:798 length:525 start_codon:yes stop_codon:yes gene_type:complete
LKIAITGHTKGIGKACADVFSEHDVIGFSRTNGFDIKQPEPILESSDDCDVFINNACEDDYQLQLFKQRYITWKDNSDKTIVNLVSKAKYLNDNNAYYENKRLLEAGARRYLFNPSRKCRIINVSPGYVLTDGAKQNIETFNFPYITAEQCAEYIKWAVDQPIEIWNLDLWKLK